MVAVLTALLAAAAYLVMATQAAQHPLVYWFGGWAPRGGQVLGIGFVVDQAGAAIAAFIGVLFAATLVFAWGYYDEVHAHFHVLMLLFMSGMVGFCLTHDLFNLFVWFEVMSVAAFALTGYALRSSALEGALNFTVVNTIGSYLILGGIGLIYPRVGALDFAALEQGVAAAPNDAVRCDCCLVRLAVNGPAGQGGAGAVPVLAVGRACGRSQPGLGDLLRRHGGAWALWCG